jgi:hypothetical protein
MPQLIDFPSLSETARSGSGLLVRICKETPSKGEPFSAFRSRLRGMKLWDSDKPSGILRFLDVVGTQTRLDNSGLIVPSPFMQQIAESTNDDALCAAVIDRLWALNPLLLKAVYELLQERPYHKDEVSKYIGSVAYRGVLLTWPSLENWIHIGISCGLLKIVGIAVALGAQAESLKDRVTEFDADGFIRTDKPWPELSVPLVDDGTPVEVGSVMDTQAVVAAVGSNGPPQVVLATRLPLPLRHLSAEGIENPRGKSRTAPLARFANGFSSELLEETAARMQSWWSAAGKQRGGYTPADFDFQTDAWIEGADEVIYRIAVAAALVFRLERDRAGVIAAYRSLESAGVLGDLYQGTVPEKLPQDVDAKSLMLASLAARRCAESPELAATLTGQSTAADALVVLEAALGRGLFRVELFWMMEMLSNLGVVRFSDIGNVTATPYRVVRDVLFRLGFIDSPYANTPAQLAVAAHAARRASGSAVAEELLVTFGLAAGCSYDCQHRRVCDVACRERLES